MTANEVLEAVEKGGFEIQGVHKRETVRGAMSRKDDIFEKVGRGLFALKEWPDALKILCQDGDEPVTGAADAGAIRKMLG